VKKEVGNRIRKLRESKDLSQQNMAHELDIEVSTYSKIERGITDPSIGRLKQIADILNVSVTDLIQENTANLKLNDRNESLGSASKKEIEQLTTNIDSIKVELQSLRNEMNTLRNAVKKTKALK